MLALVHFVGYFRHYLLGRHFTIHTDHSSLKWLREFKDSSGQVARWQERLQEYDFTCIHRPGTRHSNADALSQRPARNHGDCPSCKLITAISLKTCDNEQWSQKQANDLETCKIYAAKLNGSPKPQTNELESESWETKCLQTLRHQLLIENNMLYFQHGPNYPKKIVIPQSAVMEILQQLHEDFGSPSQRKLREAVRQRFWWPGHDRDIVNFTRACALCAQIKPASPSHRAPLQPVLSGYSNKTVGIDIIGPLPQTTKSNKYILVIVDYFTKWCEAAAISRADAQTVANTIFNSWISRWGAPMQLHSDQGTCFESQIAVPDTGHEQNPNDGIPPGRKRLSRANQQNAKRVA